MTEEQLTKTDKRKISSKQNLEKARKVKLEKLKQKKEEKHYEIESESDNDSSDSEDEVIVIQPKKKTTKKEIKNSPKQALKQDKVFRDWMRSKTFLKI